MSELLSIKDVDVGYGDLLILRHINLEVGEGDIVLVLGSNGAGKTTLLRTISGILQPKNGQIYFLGKRIDRLPAYEVVKMGISYVPSEGGIFPLMSVMENLDMGTYMAKARKKREERLNLIFQLFPILKERRNQMAGTLSGGERRMLSIARALMSSPKLLMLDEPSFGLSPKVVYELFKVIQQINYEDTTILLVEQNARQALTIADKAYVLENGSVVLEGTSSEVANNPLVKKAYLGI